MKLETPTPNILMRLFFTFIMLMSIFILIILVRK